MKKILFIFLLTTITFTSFAQLNYKNCEINFDMFAPMCSTKPGGLFGVESGASIQEPINNWLNTGAGVSYIVWVEPNLDEDSPVWNYSASLYLPVNFNTTPIKNFSFSVTGGPIFNDDFEINLMFKAGVKYIVDSGELKKNWNYKVYLYFNDVMTNFSIHGMENDNLFQVGIGISI